MTNIYKEILKNIFPKGYCMAFAYGSGVFKQLGHLSVKKNMIDFILAVDDSAEWHKKNIAANKNHYSLLRLAGPQRIANIQDSFGAKLYFNTIIPTYAGVIKYGVISKANLISDLLDWETLYISGRLHKPVFMLHLDGDDQLKAALKINLFAAVHTALLLLPDTFSEQQLYMTITALSYSGDFRMQIGEDQNKVKNIVYAQIKEFRDLYSPVFQELQEYVCLDHSRGCGEQDTSTSTKLFHLSMLPKRLQHELMREWNKDGRSRDLEDVLRAAAMDPDSRDIVYKGICKIVKISSLSQSLKGIITAGPLKSTKYSVAKIMKMMKTSNNEH